MNYDSVREYLEKYKRPYYIVQCIRMPHKKIIKIRTYIDFFLY